MKKMELLAPAGDLEKLMIAVDYGADAVYFGGDSFSLRAGADNFSLDDMTKGIAYAHNRNVRCYLAVNIFPHNEDINPLITYLKKVEPIGLDGLIVSDPGVISMAKEIMPDMELHLSTQANMTNYKTAEFWHKLGIHRLVLARELSLAEIGEIRSKMPIEMELEAFGHGAMCMSYSGRCLLSNYMVGRDANRGNCAHPCRYKYALVEEKRPGEYLPIEEDSRGTYILNANDLCMIEHIPQMVEAGISSLKIEGRMKSIFYVAIVVGAYRKAIDAYYNDPIQYEFNPKWMTELQKASHRIFTTGFYFNPPSAEGQNFETSNYARDFTFIGIVKNYDELSGIALVEQRNKMSLGETIEVFGPSREPFEQVLAHITDTEGVPLNAAPHPQQMLLIKMDQQVKPNDMLRKRKE
jgi:U32 family peptidase